MLLFLIALVVIFIIVVLLLPGRAKEKAVGICAAAVGLDARKRENKEKILALLADRGSASAQGSSETRELSNSDIREALGISDRSVIRYMDELEKEGKVEQIGNTGRGVTYRLK